MSPTHQPRPPHHVVITGASSGLGAALARHYATPGRRLTLHGRDAERLDEVARACGTKGAEVRLLTADVLDRAAMATGLVEADATTPVDLLIANAGISGVSPDADATRILQVNVQGVLNTVEPLVPRMQERGRGHIALVSSLAGFRGMPQAPAYCASKAAVRVYGEGLRGRLLAHGIAVSVVCPGFVATPMTARNPFPMPLIMSAERAAAIIARGLDRRRARIAFPWLLHLLARLLAAVPPAWIDPLLTRPPAKE